MLAVLFLGGVHQVKPLREGTRHIGKLLDVEGSDALMKVLASPREGAVAQRDRVVPK